MTSTAPAGKGRARTQKAAARACIGRGEAALRTLVPLGGGAAELADEGLGLGVEPVPDRTLAQLVRREALARPVAVLGRDVAGRAVHVDRADLQLELAHHIGVRRVRPAPVVRERLRDALELLKRVALGVGERADHRRVVVFDEPLERLLVEKLLRRRRWRRAALAAVIVLTIVAAAAVAALAVFAVVIARVVILVIERFDVLVRAHERQRYPARQQHEHRPPSPSHHREATSRRGRCREVHVAARRGCRANNATRAMWRRAAVVADGSSEKLHAHWGSRASSGRPATARNRAAAPPGVPAMAVRGPVGLTRPPGSLADARLETRAFLTTPSLGRATRSLPPPAHAG